jgi:hypothetical protein
MIGKTISQFMRKNVRYLGNALVLLCSLVISLGGLEIGIRCTHPRLVEIRSYTLFARQFHEADDTLGWKSRGNFLGVFKQAQAASRVTTNSLGMRGSPEISSVQGRKSILILGDSQAWGYGVNDDETFAHFLQEMLGDEAAVFNAGVLGYGTDQELLLLRRVGRLIRPRVVIVAVHLNDLTNIRHTEQYYLEKPIFTIFQNQLVLQNVPANNKPLFTASESKTAGIINSVLARCVSLYWIVDRIDKLKLRLSPAVATTWNYNNWIVLKKGADPQIESSWILAECLLREMKSRASELGTEVMICPLPFRERIMPQAWAGGGESHEHRHRRL